MITNIKTKGFKGKDINEPISQKTIYTGNNTVGKSSRAAAIALTVLGFVPFAKNPSKQGGIILSEFGTGDRMTTAIVCGGIEFERTFSKSEKGTVSQLLRVGKKKFSKSDFKIELFKSGNPRIIDLNDFISLSDAKKIDTLFELYPPKFDIKNLDAEIEKSKSKISMYQESDRTANATIKRLTESKNEIVLPAGSLAEIKSKIQTLTDGVKEAQNALKIAEIKNAEEVATEKAIKATKEETQANLDKQMDNNTVPFVEKEFNGSVAEHVNDADYAVTNQKLAPVYEHNVNSNCCVGNAADPINMAIININPAESIKKIMAAMEKSGCNICAALMVSKIELKKYKAVQND